MFRTYALLAVTSACSVRVPGPPRTKAFQKHGLEPSVRGGSQKLQGTSLVPLVDQGEEHLEDGPRQTALLDPPLVRLELRHDLALVLVEQLLEAELLEQPLDLGLLLAAHLTLPVVLVQVRLGLRSAELMVGVREEPAALLVRDVGAHLSENLRGGEGVEVVVLGLEVDAHHQQGLARRVIGLPVADTGDNHRKSHGEVEGVEGRLVLHHKLPPRRSQLLELAVGADGVQELAALGLERGLEEEVHEPEEVRLLPEVPLDDLVDVHLDHQEVVGVQEAHVLQPVPARGAPARH
mmetsp:Transcript_71956/g.188582  ORF Transcript_71956/g.188582 Transcript_71956/m.188582 type:complete len:293 (+) Transcript_71956:24-902(+)